MLQVSTKLSPFCCASVLFWSRKSVMRPNPEGNVGVLPAARLRAGRQLLCSSRVVSKGLCCHSNARNIKNVKYQKALVPAARWSDQRVPCDVFMRGNYKHKIY